MDSNKIKNRLRLMGRQYDNGSSARGGVVREPHYLIQAADRIDELEIALNDLLNDCINFDNGNLTPSYQEVASKILKYTDPYRDID